MIRRTTLIMLLTLLLFVSCQKENTLLTVYSDIPETAVLTDLFNQTQDSYHARFIYAGNSENGEMGPADADIIICRDIHSREYRNSLRNLDAYRSTPFVSAVYPAILKTGIEDTELKSIPLSLELPAVVSRPGLGDASKYISWEEMTALASEFNKSKDEALTGCGFSPLWSDSFLKAWFNASLPLISDFLEMENYRPFEESAETLSRWIEENNGGLERDNAYGAKYRYIPDYRLIMEGRSAFTVLPLSSWALLPDSITRELELRLLTPDGGLVALDILSAGLPADSGNPEGGDAFLRWLLSESTWEDYLKLSARFRDENFAFLGGLSASQKLNERLIPEYYPAAAPLIPRKGEFSRQPDIPPQWHKVWNNLFLPLTRDRIEGTPRDLGSEYRKWLLQNPDPWQTNQ